MTFRYIFIFTKKSIEFIASRYYNNFSCTLNSNFFLLPCFLLIISFIKPAESNQQNQIGFIGIFSTHFVLNCTINDNFILCHFEKNYGASLLSWQDQFKIKEKKKNNIRNQYDWICTIFYCQKQFYIVSFPRKQWRC